MSVMKVSKNKQSESGISEKLLRKNRWRYALRVLSSTAVFAAFWRTSYSAFALRWWWSCRCVTLVGCWLIPQFVFLTAFIYSPSLLLTFCCSFVSGHSACLVSGNFGCLCLPIVCVDRACLYWRGFNLPYIHVHLVVLLDLRVCCVYSCKCTYVCVFVCLGL